MTYFAHAGEHHEDELELQQHLEQTNALTSNYLGEVFVNILPFIVLLILWLFMTYVLKSKNTTKINVVLIYLLIVGLTTYAVAPIASIISLVIGFGLALFVVIGRVKN